jgi:hypothetical protein
MNYIQQLGPTIIGIFILGYLLYLQYKLYKKIKNGK